jgi:hypothetical protein
MPQFIRFGRGLLAFTPSVTSGQACDLACGPSVCPLLFYTPRVWVHITLASHWSLALVAQARNLVATLVSPFFCPDFLRCDYLIIHICEFLASHMTSAVCSYLLHFLSQH